MTYRILFLGLALAACGGGGSTPAAVDAPHAVDAAPLPKPTLTVTVTPAVITRGNSYTLAVATTNFTLVDPTATPTPAPRAGEGHFHVYVDAATTYGAGWVPSTMVPTALSDTPGIHMLRIVLTDSAHNEIVPTVQQTVMYTLQ